MFEPLSALVRLRREQLGLSLDALSALSRVSRTRLIALEKGDDNISLDLLVKVANAMQMTDIRIGGLRVQQTQPDFDAIVAAAEAIRTAQRIIEECAGAAKELERVAAPVFERLHKVLPPESSRDEDAGEREPRRRTARRPA